MRSDPIHLVLEENPKLEKNFYLISGNEPTLMERVKDKLIELIKKNNQFELEKIEEVSQKDNAQLCTY